MYNIFYAGFLELVENQSFSIVMTSIHDYIHLMHDESLLLDELSNNKQMLVDMKQAIVSEKEVLLDVTAKRNYKLFKANESLEDISGNNCFRFLVSFHFLLSFVLFRYYSICKNGISLYKSVGRS